MNFFPFFSFLHKYCPLRSTGIQIACYTFRGVAAGPAFCYLCGSPEKQRKLKAASKESAFLSKGFTNWKDATEGFRKHEKSSCHIDALQVMVVLPKTVPDVGEVLSSAHAKVKTHNRTMLVRILRNTKFFWTTRSSSAWA